MSKFMIVFGAIFLVVGLILSIGFLAGDMPAVAVILPLVFVVFGGVIVFFNVRKLLTAKKLRENGRKVWATVCSVDINTGVDYNGRHPYVVVCEAEGRQFRGSTFNPAAADLLGKTIAVFVSPDKPEDYVVDLDNL